MISNDNHQTYGKFCGQRNGESVVVTGHYALISFHSDAIVQRKGFSFKFTYFGDYNENELDTQSVMRS